ncbi:MAG: hypothetical protein GY801_49720 [bacterium]|nr:hypothetical protein [bacterium]
MDINKKYIVRLTEEEQSRLHEMISKGKTAAHNIKHAKMFLKAYSIVDSYRCTDE